MSSSSDNNSTFRGVSVVELTPNMFLIPFHSSLSPCAVNLVWTSSLVNHAHDFQIAPLDSLGSPANICDRRKNV